MNEIISQRETYYKNRRIAPIIREIADALPVVVITGARQVGKSTMLHTEFADYTYLTLDDCAILEQARLDPQSEAYGAPGRTISAPARVSGQIKNRKNLLSTSGNGYLWTDRAHSLRVRA